MEDVLAFIGAVLLGSIFIVLITVALNPQVWQAWRNSKFLDEYFKEDESPETKDITK